MINRHACDYVAITIQNNGRNGRIIGINRIPEMGTQVNIVIQKDTYCLFGKLSRIIV